MIAITPLTKRQKQVYDYVRESINKNGYAPSLEEICGAMHLSSLATVHKHLENLREKGVIKRRWNRSRSIEIVSPMFGKPCPHCGQLMPLTQGEESTERTGNCSETVVE